MPYVASLRRALAGLAVIATMLTMVGPRALADMAEMRTMIMSHYEQHLARLQLTAAKKASLRRILKQNVSERMDLLQRHGFTPGSKPSFFKMLSMRGDMRRLSRAQTERLARVLTKRQMAVWEAVEDELRTKIRSGMRGP